MSDLFDPPGAAWKRVQRKLALKRRLVMLLWRIVLLALLGSAIVLFPGLRTLFVALALLVVLSGVFRWWLIGRAVRNLGYSERRDDLWITSGALSRRLSVVPYGRMQLVDVQAGPLDRAFGLANVQLHTAASGTDAHIPGLTPEDAAVLRDRLTELGSAELSGL